MQRGKEGRRVFSIYHRVYVEIDRLDSFVIVVESEFDGF